MISIARLKRVFSRLVRGFAPFFAGFGASFAAQSAMDSGLKPQDPSVEMKILMHKLTAATMDGMFAMGVVEMVQATRNLSQHPEDYKSKKDFLGASMGFLASGAVYNRVAGSALTFTESLKNGFFGAGLYRLYTTVKDVKAECSAEEVTSNTRPRSSSYQRN